MEVSSLNNLITLPSFQEGASVDITSAGKVYYQLCAQDLISQSIENGEGILSSTGALVIDTGDFTGRSPKDRFIVEDSLTGPLIDWNEFNQPLEEKYYDRLYKKMIASVKGSNLWVRDCFVCAKREYRLNLRVINKNPCCNLFAYNMFLRPENEELGEIQTDWHLLQLPHFFSDPSTDGVPRKNFVIINFTKKVILIGGTQYTGEIKKSVFSILNYLLPVERNVLSMHCAANTDKKGDSAIFFGLSGTGKTTLSADPARELIGDDEHGWDDTSIFNIEGGCYAKTLKLDAEKEGDIYNAIKFGSILENVLFIEGANTIDFENSGITENTRASYPIHYIRNSVEPSVGNIPKNIFFLTADAYGVLPVISRLSPAQAMYYFISGYTAKVAGTENGIVEPKPTFSACFGAPFLPLSAGRYAAMLGDKINKHSAKVWMINTGWVGGVFGVGERIKLEYTRLMITAAIQGHLDEVSFHRHSVFKVMMPELCPGVPTTLLNPEVNWKIKDDYAKSMNMLAGYFKKNFEKYSGRVSGEIFDAGPGF